MVEENSTTQDQGARPRRRAASRPAGPPAAIAEEPAKRAAKKPAAMSSVNKGARKKTVPSPEEEAAKAEKKASKKAAKSAAPADKAEKADAPAKAQKAAKKAVNAPLFQAPEPVGAASAQESAQASAEESAPKSVKKTAKKAAKKAVNSVEAEEPAKSERGEKDEDEPRRRRRRGGRGRRRREGDEEGADLEQEEEGASADEEGEGGSRRRRRRRRRSGDGIEPLEDEPNTVVKVREPRAKGEETLRGSTRLEAKKQRRREGREAGRKRAPILTEAEFLARREAVVRTMLVRQVGDRTQIAVLEDGVLVEHYVTQGSSSSMVGNVYLGRVQNVLPSMEAAFVDIGRGRNAVLYAGEVNWDAAGLDGQPKRIEFALKSGDSVLVQVTKDPVGQKGARLTSQISLPGRFLVYVPDGSMTGISRKLPDSERSRLKGVLKRVMPADAGVIVRTAAEGASEEALEQDVVRLQSQWTEIDGKSKSANPPALLYSEPDLAIKVVRDIFNEDVNRLLVSGGEAWGYVSEYLEAVAPELRDRLEHWVEPKDLFGEFRVDEQLAKALDRKVYLPSGGSLVIDRTEAMTVIDVNTGKFTGAGGNLEQTVTKNNLEAAEEIVRQLRLRDIGGIIVVDFIDMVLESNRDLVLRRLVECLGRDRTKHQVAEVTSLGLVQMTRKRIGSGLLESFSVQCEACSGRGIKVSMHPVDHDHAEHSLRGRRPANAVDPAEVAARSLAASESLGRDEGDLVEEVESEIVHEVELAAEDGALAPELASVGAFGTGAADPSAALAEQFEEAEAADEAAEIEDLRSV